MLIEGFDLSSCDIRWGVYRIESANGWCRMLAGQEMRVSLIDGEVADGRASP